MAYILNVGMAAAIPLEAAPGAPARRPWDVAVACWERGMYVRQAGDTLQLGPPFVIEREQIDFMCNLLTDVIPGVA
ncbi:MAG: hypothetical protein JJT90_18360 [Ectothiorhodospiraceae bacterium]|nr:hypothetical protein [Ectothiorhodospiraceae bacterium]